MTDRPPPMIPSHLAWPAFVVFLLAISITMVVVTVLATRSDGGVRLVEPTAETAPAPVEASDPGE